MAKRIKAIKCPQCGSTKQEKIDAEHFRCKSCGSEYILDSDDININHHYNYPHSPAPSQPFSPRKLAAIIGFIVLAIAILLGTGLCNSSTNTTANSILESNQYYFHNRTNGFLFDAEGHPTLIHF